MNPVKIVVAGGAGRMGQRILALALADERIQILGALENAGNALAGKTLENGRVNVYSRIQDISEAAHVWIDFTTTEATLAHLAQAPKNAAFVIGTTGFSDDERRQIEAAARQRAIVFSYNMSVGINLLLALVKEAASKIGHYDIEILETHHNQKKDAPSGTAVMLAETISKELDRTANDWVHGRVGNTGVRKKTEIGIHAIRAGDTVGDHTVLFATQGERLELTHRASSRDAFASGALRAALWLVAKKPGLYNMKDVLSA